MYSSCPAHHDEVLADVASHMLGKGKGTPFDLSSMYLQLPLFHPPAICINEEGKQYALITRKIYWDVGMNKHLST
jgi:hypothetical protein